MRNLGLILALMSAVFLPTNSLALGLGEIEVKSFLNQPLNAEIEVISARPGEIDDLLVSLASRDAFTRAGLSRPRHLTELRFAVRKDEDGENAVVVVTTKGSVKEPFLNFLIEADWSKGRVLREFTILLDPPFYADQPAPATETASAAPAPEISDDQSVSAIVEQAGVSTTTADQDVADSEPIAAPIAIADESPQPEPASEEYVSDETQNIIEGDVLVVKGDTLWSIASRYKDDAHSMAQVMLAFQRTNPDAFTDGNINNMKEGAILRAPSAAEIDALGQQEAYAEVLVQNGLWDEYVARVTGVEPVMATQADDSGIGEADTEEQVGELSLVMPADGDSESTGISDTADIDELRTKLAIAEEELDAARIENAELESRITELQARLSKVEELQKMVEIEDDSLAQLQADQAAEDSVELPVDTTESDAAVPEEAVSEAIQADEEALLEELLAEEAAAQAEEQAALDGTTTEPMVSDEMTDDVLVDDEMASDEMTSDEMASDEMASDEMVDDEMADDEMVADDSATTEESDAVSPPPAPVIITEPAREPSMLDGILPPEIVDALPSLGGLGAMLGNPIVLAAIGGVVVLLLVLMLLKRRRASAEDDEAGPTPVVEDDMFAGDEEEELTPIHLADGSEPEETDIKVPTDEDMMPEQPPADEEPDDEFGKTAVVSQAELPEPEAEAPAAAAPAEQDDVLNEVDVYLAYGLYDNAEELLSSNLVENPDRVDYRAKLLDTYFATKKADEFVGEAEKLKPMGEVAAPYWDRVQIMGYELAPDNALFSDAKDSGMSAADLEFTKPQEADFDLGAADEDDTNFSTTDFNLGEEDTGGDFTDTQNMGEAGEIAETQQIPQITELPDLDDEDETNIRAEALADSPETDLELPDEIGDELEFSMEEDEPTPAAEATGVLELPDDLDLGAEQDGDLDLDAADVDMDEIAAEFDADAEETGSGEESEMDLGAEFEAALEEADDLDLDDSEMIPFADDDEEPTGVEMATDEDAVELSPPDEYESTSVITPNYEDTEVVPAAAGAEDSLTDDDASEIDLGMDDTSMMAEDSEETGELNLDTGELHIAVEDDDEDISIIDFGGDDFVEPTDVVESVDDESVALDVDMDDGEEVKTGTFAPGDFEEPTAATESVADIDDIGDLMLPDDVDEVSTKLDLARAFIDMGDTEGARGSLEEVIAEGNEEQKTEAKALLDQI